MDKTSLEIKRLFGQHTWQTDDLIISIRADVGRLEDQLRNIDQQQQYNAGVTTASAIKSMAYGFWT